jgi:hypothetical protein
MALISCPECGREVSDKAPTCPTCGAPIASQPSARSPIYVSASPQPEKKNISCLQGGCVILLVLFLIGLVAGECGKSGTSNTGTSLTPSASPAPSREDVAKENVELVDFSWKTGGFDNIMMATFVVRNNNDFPVKDITIQCNHSAKSGTEIDSNTKTIYETIAAKKKKTFRDFNMGFIHSQAASSRCHVTGVVPAG